MDNQELDINHLNKWLGNTEIVTDYLTPIVEQRYRATLNIDPGDPKIGEASPILGSPGSMFRVALYRCSTIGVK